MNSVIYYSCTGYSKKIALYVAKLLEYSVFDIENLDDFNFDNLVLIFPVHAQNIPFAVKKVLPLLNAQNVIIIATYGKMCYGRVIYEIQNYTKLNVIGGIYLPTKHSYLPLDSEFTDYQKLNFIKERFHSPNKIIIPKTYKNIFANFLTVFRGQLGVKLIRTNKCTDCGLCKRECNNKNCIRCLKCVKTCPLNALTYKLNPFLSLYLKKKNQNDLIIY